MFDYFGRSCVIALTGLLLAISKGGRGAGRASRHRPVPVALGCWCVGALRTGGRPAAGRPADIWPPAGAATNIASVLLGFAMFGNLLPTTQELQLPAGTGYGFGLPVIIAGLCMLPPRLAMVVFAPVSAGINRSGGQTTLSSDACCWPPAT